MICRWTMNRTHAVSGPNRLLLAAVIAGGLGCLFLTTSAPAATFTVTNLDGVDPPTVGSLGWAVQQANSAAGCDTIDFAATVFGIITLVDAPLKVEGADLPGVYPATEFLIRTNVRDHYLPQDMPPLTDVGKKVVVIGGGDTASDSLRSALRLGAEEVTCLYRRTEREMPGGKKDRTYAREEGARYQFLTQPIRFLANDDGQLAAVECLRMELGEPDESGRRRPVPVEGSNFIVEADTAVLALGYWPDSIIGDTTPELETHNWGLIVTDPKTGATTRPGVYAGGDAVTGPDLVVTAMYAGRQSAAAIDEYLNNK